MPPAGFQESATHEVQTPPEGHFSSVDLEWIKSLQTGEGHYREVDVAHIPTNRVEDFISGESVNIEGGTRFVKIMPQRHDLGSLLEPYIDSYVMFSKYMCVYGPEDWRIDSPMPRAPQPAVEAGKKGRRKRADIGESVKHGCLCSFGVKQLYATPNVTEIIYYQKEHTDARGILCHDIPRIWQLSQEQVVVFKNLVDFRDKIANEKARKGVTNELLFRVAEKVPDNVTKLLDLLTEQEKELVVGCNVMVFMDVIKNSRCNSLVGTQQMMKSSHGPDLPGIDPLHLAQKMVFNDNAVRQASSLFLSHGQPDGHVKDSVHQMSSRQSAELFGLHDVSEGERAPEADTEQTLPKDINIQNEESAAPYVEYQPAIQLTAAPLTLLPVPLVPFQVMFNPMIFAPLAARSPIFPPVPNFEYLDASSSTPAPPVPSGASQLQYCQQPDPLQVGNLGPPEVVSEKTQQPMKKRARRKGRDVEPGSASPSEPPPLPKTQMSILDALCMYNFKPSSRPKSQASVLDALDALYFYNIKPCLRPNESTVLLVPYSMCTATSRHPVPASAMAGWRQHMKDPTLLVPVLIPAGYQPVYIPPGSVLSEPEVQAASVHANMAI